MQEQMYGVVLWTDDRDSKAVIWCEDHGNLAFYSDRGGSLHDGVSLDAGDLIQFEVGEEQDMRMARNPQRVEAGHAPSLASDLRSGGRRRKPATRRGAAAGLAKILQFPAVPTSA